MRLKRRVWMRMKRRAPVIVSPFVTTTFKLWAGEPLVQCLPPGYMPSGNLEIFDIVA